MVEEHGGHLSHMFVPRRFFFFGACCEFLLAQLAAHCVEVSVGEQHLLVEKLMCVVLCVEL